MNFIKRHAALFVGFFRASAIADLEYRLNLLMKVFTDLIWYTAQLSVFEVLFSNVPKVAGWTLDSTRVFMATLFVLDSVWMLLFAENLDRLSDRIRKGELDLLLVKPVNSQFMLSFQRMSTAYVFNIAITVSYLIWAFSRVSPDPASWIRLLSLIVLIPCSLGIMYGIRFFFSASALIFTSADNINYLWYQFYRLGTRPDALYPAWLRYAVLTIIPVGFLASVPARIVLGTNDLVLVAGSMGFAALFIYISTRYWKFALKFYSSASS